MANSEKSEVLVPPLPHALISRKAREITKTINKNTGIAYNRVWRDFSEFVDNAQIHDFNDLTQSHVAEFLLKYQKTPFAYNQARGAIIKMLHILIDDENIVIERIESIKRGVKRRKEHAGEKLFLNARELKQVRDNIAPLFASKDVRARNFLIFDLMEQTLMRADEIALIQLSDINIINKTIAVRGKGAGDDGEGGRVTSARIPLKAKYVKAIVEYVSQWRIVCDGEKMRPNLEYPTTINAGAPLLSSRHKKVLDISTIKNDMGLAVSSLYKTDCVPKNHGAHAIRRSKANIIYKKTKDIVLVQKMLRHVSQLTTLKYLGVEQEELEEAFLADYDN